MAGSDTLEDVEAGLGHDPDDVNTECADPTRDPERALDATGRLTRSVREGRNGYSLPRPWHEATLVRAVADFARERCQQRGLTPAVGDLGARVADLAASWRTNG